MPLPLLVMGSVAALASVGVKQVFGAYSDRKEAKRLNEDGEEIFYRAETRLKRARTNCEAQLKALGQLKIVVWHRQLGRFVCLFQKLHNVDLQGTPRMDELGDGFEASLAEMQDVTRRVAEAVCGGAIAAPSGALVGLAAYGSATLFATASTGTAISSLSGVAATNATLAWFGGGSLAAGGLGVAGGTAVVGGIAVVPVLAVGGIVSACKAAKVLDEAKENHALNEAAAKQMRKDAATVRGIAKVAVQFREALAKLDECTSEVLNDLEDLLHRRGSDYAEYAESERRIVYRAKVFANGLKEFMEAPLLDERGALAKGHRKALEHGLEMLPSNEES